MLLSYDDLLLAALDGVIEGVDPGNINSASIDLTLGDEILVEMPPPRGWQMGGVSLADREPLTMSKVSIADGYTLAPGEFILAHSREVFNLPNDISGEYKLKSSMARIGLEHLNAGWCDAGWHGSCLTFEFKNMTRYHGIRLKAGDKIGQIVLFRHAPVPGEKSYAARGRYNGDRTVSAIKE